MLDAEEIRGDVLRQLDPGYQRAIDDMKEYLKGEIDFNIKKHDLLTRKGSGIIKDSSTKEEAIMMVYHIGALCEILEVVENWKKKYTSN